MPYKTVFHQAARPLLQLIAEIAQRLMPAGSPCLVNCLWGITAKRAASDSVFSSINEQLAVVGWSELVDRKDLLHLRIKQWPLGAMGLC